jgi:excisionase family DNA binding protein
MSKPARIASSFEWKVLTIPEVSLYLRVSRKTVYRMLQRKELPAFRLGGDWRINVEDLERWIERGTRAREAVESYKR